MNFSASGADGIPFERHLIKRRPGRREAVFLGRTRLVEGQRVVEEGWIIKTVGSERARRLVAHYQALGRALPGDGPGSSGLPRVPALVDQSVPEGWLALEAFAGQALSGWRDGPSRNAALQDSVAALARLESAESVRVHWPDRHWSAAQEAGRLADLARETGQALPPFAEPLLARLVVAEQELGSSPAHRDLNEEQIVVLPEAETGDDLGMARWIDWDEAAIAPVGLDLGNLLAHERLRDVRAGRALVDQEAILAAYRQAGGRATPRQAADWEAVACLRLAFLALRAGHGDDGERNPEWVPALPRDAIEAENRALALVAMARDLVSG